MKKIITFAAVIFLCQCNRDTKEPFTNQDIVLYNAQAALYFHTVFREAENAWAFVDSMKYKEGTYPDAENKSSAVKKMTVTCDKSKVTLDIEYNSWETNLLLLSGTIKLKFDTCSYRKNGKDATVSLSDFSINGQPVLGESSIKFNRAVGGKDSYNFSLFEGSAIHEQGRSMPVLISCTVSNGQYERAEGNETFTQEDDVWVYSSVMTGMLRNDPNLKYTNTVINSYLDNGQNKDGRIYYSMNCKQAKQGISRITFLKRPEIVFFHGCSGYYFESVTHIE